MDRAYTLAAQRRKFQTTTDNLWVRILCRSDKLKKYRRRQARGKQRIERELDIARFIRRQIQLSQFFKYSLTPVQRFFIKSNKKFVLYSSGGAESEVEQSSSEAVPGVNRNAADSAPDKGNREQQDRDV